ncbi:MAG TPA: metallophosphoesterase, partial [Allosphingosinicella sp.]|nr:metallophosphoesterase [Allosphingosinicella sp.]
MNDPSTTEPLTVAAIGDLHVTETCHNRYRALFEEISEAADVLALAGDLTNFGKAAEAEILAEDLRACTIPVVAVLGNHDYEAGEVGEVVRILQSAGVIMLGEQAIVIEGVGFAGAKGFIGGFGRGELGAFGEDAIKVFVDESRNEARLLENALRSLRTDHGQRVARTQPRQQALQGLEPAQRAADGHGFG